MNKLIIKNISNIHHDQQTTVKMTIKYNDVTNIIDIYFNTRNMDHFIINIYLITIISL